MICTFNHSTLAASVVQTANSFRFQTGLVCESPLTSYAMDFKTYLQVQPEFHGLEASFRFARLRRSNAIIRNAK